ncbi:MAG: hypothetical protein Tsb0014_45080 [Pleurocapsa sp.]
MTNSSPQPPVPPRPDGEPEERRKIGGILTLDEMIAVIVAFATIGAILFWSLGGRKQDFSLSGWLNGWLFPQSETESTTAAISSEIKEDKVLEGKTESDTSELTSKYLGSKPQLPSEKLDTKAISPSMDAPSKLANKAAPIATGLALGTSGAILSLPPETVEKTPTTTETTPPETVEKTPVTTETTPPETVEKTPTTTETTPPETVEKTPATTPQIAFKDIPDTYWAYPFVEKLGEKKLISGFSQDNIFEPEKLITRASMASLISQAFDQPANLQAKNFSDVSPQNAIAADINKAVQIGFMKGYSDNEFRPLENIPRYQVLVALATGLGLKPSQDTDQILGQFNDTEGIPNWAKEQVAAAAEAGLIVNPPGVSNNTIEPNQEATRAEVAAMIHQALVKLNTLEPIESQYIVQP